MTGSLILIISQTIDHVIFLLLYDVSFHWSSSEINTFRHFRFDIGFKGTIENRALLYLHGGSFEISVQFL